MELQTGIHASQAKRNPQTRVISIGIVIALHIAALYAIINGFHNAPIHVPMPGHYIPIPPDKTHAPPPPPPSAGTFLNPASPPLSGPDINIQRDDGNPITPPPTGAGQSITLTTAEPLIATHTTPPYPALALRLGEQGTAILKIGIAADGSVSDAIVQTSSGSERLDAAAIAWVKAHWRYKPATRGGAAIASTTLAAVKFDLRTAR